MTTQIDPKDFTDALQKVGLGPVIQVPCSYFKDWLNYLWDTNAMEVIGPANEALVMGRAAGRYLGSGQIPIVAMQNSGFMNSLNALTSLNQIYDIPLFYIITWRGEGGVGKDAPEHDITGEHLLDYLKVFTIPYEIIDSKEYKKQIQRLAQKAKRTKKPVAFIVTKNSFEPYLKKQQKDNSPYEMNRFDAIRIIKNAASQTKAIFISSTGFPTRDSFAAAESPDFYIMGSMGHAFEIGLGVAEETKKKVIILDGDGSALMHAGGLADFDPKRHKNLIYIVLDNASYESTGGQPNLSSHVGWKTLAKSVRFKNPLDVHTKKMLTATIHKALKSRDGVFLHVRIRNEDRPASKRVSDVYSCPEVTERFQKSALK